MSDPPGGRRWSSPTCAGWKSRACANVKARTGRTEDDDSTPHPQFLSPFGAEREAGEFKSERLNMCRVQRWREKVWVIPQGEWQMSAARGRGMTARVRSGLTGRAFDSASFGPPYALNSPHRDTIGSHYGFNTSHHRLNTPHHALDRLHRHSDTSHRVADRLHRPSNPLPHDSRAPHGDSHTSHRVSHTPHHVPGSSPRGAVWRAGHRRQVDRVVQPSGLARRHARKTGRLSGPDVSLHGERDLALPALTAWPVPLTALAGATAASGIGPQCPNNRRQMEGWGWGRDAAD